MKNNYTRLPFALLLLLLPLRSWSQSISVPTSQPVNPCVSSVLSVSFTTAGTFAADNVFRVQLSPDGGLTYADLPGSSGSSPVSATLPATAIENSSYVYRVVASNPPVVSAPSAPFKFVLPPTAQLTGTSSGTNSVNAFSLVNLQITLTGGAPYVLTLQDSTQLTKNDDSSNPSDFSVTVTQPTTYKLLGVRNACGTGVVSGSAVVAINKTAFLLQTRQSDLLCLGATVPIYFSTATPLPANTVFEAEIINTRENNRAVAVPVSGNTSPLQLTLPAELPGFLPYGYQLRIFSRTAGISAYYNEPFGAFFYGPTQITMPTAVSLTAGQSTTYASLSYVSSQGGNIVLSDGQAIWTSGSGFNDRGTVSFRVDPSVATSYSVVSFTGGCSAGVTFGNRVTRVITPPIRIDSLSTNSVCIGQPVTVYYTAPVGYKLPTRLTMRLKSVYQDDPGVAAEVVLTKPGQLTFTPPASMLPIAGGSIQVRDAAVDTLVGAWTGGGLTIKSVPRLSFTKPQQTISTPGEQFLEVTYYGGGVTRLQLTDGTMATLRNGYYNDNVNSVRAYAPQTTTFTTLSVTNECGTMPTVAATTVSLPAGTLPTPGLYISQADAFRDYYCPNQAVWLNIAPGGTFEANNKFQVEVGTSYPFSGTVIQTIDKAESMSITLPAATSGRYVVRVSSTNPVTHSNTLSFEASNNSPFFTVNVNPGNDGVKSTTGSPLSVTIVPPGQSVYALYNRESIVPSTYEFSDGTFSTNDLYLVRSLMPKVTTTYTLKRVTNACGQSVTPVASPVTVVVQPLQILTFTAGNQACVNAPVKVEFVQSGVIPSSLSYVVQATVSGQENWQTLPTSGTASPLTTYIPASLANQQLSCRVAYITSGVLIPSRFTVGLTTSALPNVTLTGPNNVTTIELNRNGPTTAELNLTDALVGGTAILSNGSTSQAVSTSTTSKSVFVSQPGTYSLISAYNGCGYGQTQGVVRVTEKPYLALSTVNKAVACVGEAVSLSYAVGGSSDAGNKLSIYLVDGATQAKTLLTETATLSGFYSLTLPALRAGNYSLQYITSAPSATLVGASLTVRTPVSVALVSGTRAVYATDVPTLPISTTGVTSPYTLTLVTPTSQTVLLGAFTNALPLAGFQPGTYTLAGVANECGAGRTTGTISLSVLPASSVTIRPTVADSLYCTDKQYVIGLTTTGSFSSINAFTAYLFDAAGNQLALPTVSGTNQLTVTIPASVSAGDGYVLRVGSSSPAHVGASLGQNLSVRPSPTATLAGNVSIFRGDTARVSVVLTGTPPWQIVLTDKVGSRTYTANQSPFSLPVKPDTTTSFRLTDVRNSQCGTGTVSGTALVTVSPVLATEPALPLTVRVWPNPTAGVLQIEGELAGSGTLSLSLHSLPGRLVAQQTVQPSGGRVNKQLDLSQLPAGVYILRAEQDGRRSQFKVLKE